MNLPSQTTPALLWKSVFSLYMLELLASLSFGCASLVAWKRFLTSIRQEREACLKSEVLLVAYLSKDILLSG
jgi:hypothetical protein